MLGVVMLSVAVKPIMLSVIMLSVVLLSVVGPFVDEFSGTFLGGNLCISSDILNILHAFNELFIASYTK